MRLSLKNWLKKNWKSVLGFLAGIFVWFLVKENILNLSYPAWGYLIFGAIDFDGVDDSIDVANGSNFDINDYLTVAGWIKLDDSSRHTFIAKSTGAAVNGGWDWDYGGFTTGQIEFGVHGGPGIYIYVGAAMSTGTWHHVAGVFNKDLSGNNRLKLYLDGVFQSGATYTTAGVFTTILNNNEIVRIGSRSSTGDLPLAGSVSDTLIYNKSLTAAEIAQLANPFLKGMGDQVRPDDRVLDLRLDDGPIGSSGNGTTFEDKSGGGNDGTGDDGAGSGLIFDGGILSYPGDAIYISSAAGISSILDFERAVMRGSNGGVMRGVC